MLAPRLPSGSKRTHWFWRVVQLLAVCGLIYVFSVGYFVLDTANYFLCEKTVTSKELYHNAWKAVRDNIYDQGKLKDWADWEHKYDDRIENDADALKYASEMVSSLGDPYTRILSPEVTKASYEAARGKFSGIGIELEMKEGVHVIKGVLRGSPALAAGLRRGDEIVSIDDLPVFSYSPDELRDAIHGELGTSLNMEVRRSGKIFTKTVERAEVSVPVVTTEVLPGKVGYLRIDSFVQLDTDKQVLQGIQELNDCDSLIVDVRSNPGGFVHSALLSLSLFLDDGLLATERFRIPASGYLECRFNLTSFGLMTTPMGVPAIVPRHPNLSRGRPIVVLVDGGTASAAEIFAAALKDSGRAVIVGAKTFGKGIGQTYVPIGNGARLAVTNFRGFTPNGDWLGDGAVHVANGIMPHVVVEGSYDRNMSDEPDAQVKAALVQLGK